MRHAVPKSKHAIPDSKHAIVVEQLCKRYGSLQAVNKVSFTVENGEVFAFLGPNGAGKSTTAEIIETIREPTSGKITVLGMDVTRSKAKIVRRIGVLPQNFNSFDRITVRESLLYYAQVFGCNADVDALMDLTHLRSKANVLFKTLSGGLKQRLGIAAALVNDPEIVFLDEPTTGLDPHARQMVWDVLKGLKRGKTIFLTTHYMEEAELLADTVAIISKGKIVATDSPARLTEKHADHLRLTLGSSDAAISRLASKMGFDPIRTSDESICIPVNNADDVRAILGEIERTGLSLRSIDVRKPNLEEVFLKLTEERHADAANGSSK
jgi:ABC-2 type transport system ATP-binding protein